MSRFSRTTEGGGSPPLPSDAPVDVAMPAPSHVPAAMPTPPPLPQQITEQRRMTRERMESYNPPPAPPYEPPQQDWHLPRVHAEIEYCGTCPKWKRANPLAPFGQCLAAMRFLGVSMYTPDMASCSWTMEQRSKAR